MCEQVCVAKLHKQLDQMNQNQLRSFVSSLTKEVKLLYGVTCPKPVWWPEDLVWATPDLKPHKHVHGQWVKTEAVRDIVRNFYEYYGLAKVLPARGGIMLNSFPVTENMVGSTCLMSGSESKKDNDTAACVTVPNDEAMEPEACMKYPVTRRSLEISLDKSDKKRNTSIFRTSPSQPVTASATVKTSRSVKRLRCKFCDKAFVPECLHEHQSFCASRSKLPLVQNKSNVANKHSASGQNSFCDALFLMPVAKVDKQSRKHRQTVRLDMKPANIDYPTPTKTPPPMSPRSLFYKLNLSKGEDIVKGNMDNAGSVGDRSEDDENEQPLDVSTSLLEIDLSSYLGQKISKLVRSPYSFSDCDTNNPATSTIDHQAYCRTPIKNNFVSKLRQKVSDFPVTYRKKRKHANLARTYKFTRRDRREWCLMNKTGLDKSSRALKKSMRPCHVPLLRLSKICGLKKNATTRPSVCLYPLTREQIIYWISPKKGKKLKRGTSLHKVGTQSAMRNKSRVCIESPIPERGRVRSVCKPSMPEKAASTHCADLQVCFRRAGPINCMAFGCRTTETLSIGKIAAAVSKSVRNGVLTQKSASATTVKRLLAVVDRPTRQSMLPVSGSTNGVALNEQAKCVQSIIRTKHLTVSLPIVATPTSCKRAYLPASNPINVPAILAQEVVHFTSGTLPPTEVDDDVLMISSDEDSCVPVENRRRLPRRIRRTKRNPTLDSCPSLNTASSILFRCRLCDEALVGSNSMTGYVGEHYSKMHGVYDIQLVQHLDANGHRVVTVVQGAAESPRPARRELQRRDGSTGTPLLPLQQCDNGLRSPAKKRPLRCRNVYNMGAQARTASPKNRTNDDVICLD